MLFVCFQHEDKRVDPEKHLGLSRCLVSINIARVFFAMRYISSLG